MCRTRAALTCVFFTLIVSPFAHAQPSTSGSASGTRPVDASKSPEEIARRKRLLEGAIERRARTQLNGIVDDFLSRRLERSDYTLTYDMTLDGKAITSWMESWNDAEFGVLLSEVAKRDYETLRPFLSQAGIAIGFSDKLSDAETTPVVESLEAYFTSKGGDVESVEPSRVTLAPALPERIARLQVDEAKRQVEREAGLRRQQVEQEANLRRQQMAEEKRLELDNGRTILKEAGESKVRELSSDLGAARRKLVELKEQLLTEENIKERLTKEYPLLTRQLAIGAGVGSLVLIALLFLGVLVIFASRALGGFFVRGTEGLADALREQGGKKEAEPKQLEPFQEEKQADIPPEELEEDALVEFENKPQLKEAAEQLKAQVQRDLATTAAILSKVVEQEKFGEVVAIFDLFGPELARQVFERFTSAAKRLLQRAFFTGQIKRVGAGKLFNRVNEIRTMLATTDVLMSESTDKAFAQVVLSFSDEEIAQAVSALEIDHASTMLSVLPPDRMFRILRQLKKDRRERILSVLGTTVENGQKLSADAVSLLTSQLLDEKKLKVQENVRYLKVVVGYAEDEEFEAITQGLEHNARLLLDVIGVRANESDLWTQTVDLLEGLFSMLELESAAVVLFTAPAEVRAALLDIYPERKRALTEDALDNLQRDEAHRETLQPVLKAARKTLLARLSEMAEAGTVTLPSRERLLAMAIRQEAMAEVTQSSDPVRSTQGNNGNLPTAV